MRGYSRKFTGARGNGSTDLPGLVATARLDHRTKSLTRRLRPGDIAIIDHADLDRVSAESLLSCEVAGVINAARSMTGRYPNLGPQLLIEAGVPLIDDVGADVFEKVREGRAVRLDGDTLYVGEVVAAKGTVQTAGSVAAAMINAKAELAAQIRAFMANTVEYISRDFEELIDGIRVPELRTKLEGRHALVIARGYRHREDLQALGAEIVVHAYADGEAPGLERVQALGLDSVLCPASGTSEDVAVLLADELGARLIVAVGMRYNLVEFLDKGRPGMASAILTRMRVGDKIVEPKGVSRLYQSRISTAALVLLMVAAAVTIVVALAVLPAGQIIFRFADLQLSAFWHWLTGLFS